MKDFREQDFYELLELHPRATAEEVEERYQTARRFLSPDSVATYALFQGEELELIRRRIEEAYRVLSQPERRQAYDQDLDRVRGGFPPPEDKRPQDAPAPAISEPAVSSAAPASGPAVVDAALSGCASEPQGGTGVGSAPPPAPTPPAPSLAPAEEAPSPPAAASPKPSSESSLPPPPDIGEDTVFSGEILRRLRESRGLSLDKVSELTKINIFYLRAIENDTFANFPAEVYVRGYLRLLAGVYRLPAERLIGSYLSRVPRAKD
ncbi:MAG: DnaJ domain-containing protein [Myxococcales bacterium]|nr:DnaJ domain-containing protein [Myxococcales bacterium]